VLRLALQGLMELVWPPLGQCLSCSADLPRTDERQPGFFEEPLCITCWEESAFDDAIDGARCSICARPLCETAELCGECAGESPFGKVWAIGPYQGPLRVAIHELKFYGRERLAVPLGRALASQIGTTYDWIVPLPLHWFRRRLRGYNQAELLAHEIGLASDIPVLVDSLIRHKWTRRQAKLDRVDRLANLRHAFGTRTGKVPWMNGSVLLVDDVLTTGATAAAAAEVVKRTGARLVDLAVLAVSTTPVSVKLPINNSSSDTDTLIVPSKPTWGRVTR